MNGCKLIVHDEVNIQLLSLTPDVKKKLYKKFRYEIPSAKFMTAYKLGRWDGYKSTFSLTGWGFLNELDVISDTLRSNNFEITEIEDRRFNWGFEFPDIAPDFWGQQGKTWPIGHEMAGEPIVLRDYQLDAINTYLKNPQSIQEISTGGGKCLAGDTAIIIEYDPTTDFGQFLYSRFDPIIDIFCDLTSAYMQLPIRVLADYIEEFESASLVDNQELYVKNLGIFVRTPEYKEQVSYFIKKPRLPIVKITFETGYEIKVARQHIFQSIGMDMYAKDVVPGTYLDHRDQRIMVISVEDAGIEDCYDLAIPSPHLYYDANGLVHHNTIITATLSKICEPYGRTMVIVPTKNLVVQTEQDYIAVGLDVGVYFGDRKELDKKHTICTWQSLNVLEKKRITQETSELTEFICGVACVMSDECHLSASDVMQKLLTQNFKHTPLRWGLTGTIPKSAYDKAVLLTSIGPVVNQITAKNLQDKGVLSNCNIKVLKLIDYKEFKSYQEEIKYLVTDPSRIGYISELCKKIAESGNTLILVNRIATGEMLQEMIPDSVFVRGQTKLDDRMIEYDAVKTQNDKTIIATFGVASTGINLVRVYNIVLIEPGKSFVRVIQSIGRGLRKGSDKEHVTIWDITSTCKRSSRHLTSRRAYYREAQYPHDVSKVSWQ